MTPDLARRVHDLERVLDQRGSVTFPPGGWAGWTPERLEQARAELRTVIEIVASRRPLLISEDDGGTVRIVAANRLN